MIIIIIIIIIIINNNNNYYYNYNNKNNNNIIIWIICNELFLIHSAQICILIFVDIKVSLACKAFNGSCRFYDRFVHIVHF